MCKLVFYKPWGQIGCKQFPAGTNPDAMIDWLEANHSMDQIIDVRFIV